LGHATTLDLQGRGGEHEVGHADETFGDKMAAGSRELQEAPAEKQYVFDWSVKDKVAGI
jgi:hypothetical protein